VPKPLGAGETWLGVGLELLPELPPEAATGLDDPVLPAPTPVPLELVTGVALV